MSLSVLLVASALAQSGADGHGLHPAALDGDLRDPIGFVRPGAMRGGQAFGSVLVDFADRSIDVAHSFADPEKEPTRDRVLDDVLTVGVSAGVAVHRRLRFDAWLPVHVLSRGPSGPQGAALGEARLSALLVAFSPGPRNRFGLGATPWLDLPTGSPERNLGRSGAGGGAAVALTHEGPLLTGTVSVGFEVHPAADLGLLTLSSQAVVGLAGSVNLGAGRALCAEGRMSLASELDATPWTASPGEWTLTWRTRAPSGAFFLFGGGAGFTRGVGAPRWRLLLGGGFGRVATDPIRDRDGDGIVDPDDTCPREPETINRYLDEDGCPDALGALTVQVVGPDGPIPGAVEIAVQATGFEGSIAAGDMLAELVPGTYRLAVGTSDWLGSGKVEVVSGLNVATVQVQAIAPGRITIRVIGPEGEPVPGARVVVSAGDTSLSPEVVDGQGFAEVKAGGWAVAARAEGWSESATEVTVGAGEATTVTLELRPERVRVGVETLDFQERIYFEHDSAVIHRDSMTLIREIGEVLSKHPELESIEIAGHTDSVGADAYNLWLSDERAKAVRAELIRLGIAGDRLVARGYGEAKPVATNATPEGRSKNRRVELIIRRRTSP